MLRREDIHYNKCYFSLDIRLIRRTFIISTVNYKMKKTNKCQLHATITIECRSFVKGEALFLIFILPKFPQNSFVIPSI